jgi:hypothetical protein
MTALYIARNRDSSFSRGKTEESWIDSREGKEICSFSRRSRPSLGPNQPVIRMAQRDLYPGEKPWREFHHSQHRLRMSGGALPRRHVPSHPTQAQLCPYRHIATAAEGLIWLHSIQQFLAFRPGVL